MKKYIDLLTILATVVVFSPFALAQINSVTPSTNNQNRINDWAHVNQKSMSIGNTELEFVSTRSFYSCFEYRTDGDTTQMINPTNYNTNITDGLYPYICVRNETKVQTITAEEYVEVRMVFGAESDERFDWTRFDVVPAISTPEVTGFLNPSLTCGALTTIHSTTVDWTDVTGGVGGVDGYEYNVHYPLADGSGFGNWTTYVTQSQYSGSLNEGTHTVRVRAKDHAGNYSEWSNECSITTDWSAPDVTLTNPLEGAILSGEVEIRGSVEDDNPHHYWLVIENSGGNKVWGPGTVDETSSLVDAVLGNWDTTLVPDGIYTVKLEARDSANNKDTGSVDWNTVTVKNTPDPIDPPVNKDQCKNDGWKEFNNPEFKNQGQCVSYVQANEKSGKRD